MRISDITSTPTRIDEAPAGMIGQGLKRVGAKVAGAVGMKGTAAGLTGKADTGAEANQLMTDLKGYLGRTGGNLKQLAADDLMNFLQQKGYPTDALKGVTGILPPAQVDKALLGAVQAKARVSGPASTAAPSASTTPKSGAVPKASAAPKASTAAPRVSATPKASTAAPRVSATPTASVSVKDLMQNVNQLDTAQKQQLEQLLKSDSASVGVQDLATQLRQAGPDAVSQALSALTVKSPETPTAQPTGAAQPSDQTRQDALARAAQRRTRPQQSQSRTAAKPRIKTSPATSEPVR